MRRLVLILLASIITGSGDAQQMLYSASMREALMKRNHKVYYIKTLTDSIVTPNGLVVYANGKIRDPKSGNVYTMSDGDCLRFKGALIVCYVWINNDDGVRFKKRLIRICTVLSKPVTLENGIYAMPDGTLKLQTGSYVKLKDSDFMGFTGNDATAYK